MVAARDARCDRGHRSGTLAGATVWYLNRGPSLPPMVTRLSLDLPDGQTFTGTTRHIVAISPDGRQIIYAANDRLYIRSMAQLDVRPIQGTEGDSREPSSRPMAGQSPSTRSRRKRSGESRYRAARP